MEGGKYSVVLPGGIVLHGISVVLFILFFCKGIIQC